MDITEKRKPQDGSFSAQVEDRFVDFRVATAGSVVGREDGHAYPRQVAGRSSSLTQLGMRDKMRDQIRSIVTQPHGMFIVCGPTGAGKSTTLYACLNEIDRFQQNIITVENPVEYQLDNVTQIEVNPKAGKTFAGELRSILRQDPDVIMIGEIRDQETAEIACQAAQTGHMVFTTLHANDTVTALGRLIDLGVQPFMIASAISAILGQRLVRMLCPHCKVRYKPNPSCCARRTCRPTRSSSSTARPTRSEQADERGRAVRALRRHRLPQAHRRLRAAGHHRQDPRADPREPGPRRHQGQEAVKSGMRYLYEDGLRQVIEGDDLDQRAVARVQVRPASPPVATGGLTMRRTTS